MTEPDARIIIRLDADLRDRLREIADVQDRPLSRIIRQELRLYADTHKVQNCVHCGEKTTSTFGGDTPMCPEHMSTGDARRTYIQDAPHPFEPQPRNALKCVKCGFKQADHARSGKR